MASGLLGKAALAASTYTSVYQVSVTKTATANIRVVNRDQYNIATIRLAVCPSGWASGAPALADYIEPIDFVLPAGGVLEETGMALSAGEQVVAFSNIASVTVRVHGFEA